MTGLMMDPHLPCCRSPSHIYASSPLVRWSLTGRRRRDFNPMKDNMKPLRGRILMSSSGEFSKRRSPDEGFIIIEFVRNLSCPFSTGEATPFNHSRPYPLLGGGCLSSGGHARQLGPAGRCPSSRWRCGLDSPVRLGSNLGTMNENVINSLTSSNLEINCKSMQLSGLANEVRKEIQRCYELVHKLGRGTIYLGSSRVKKDHPHYLQARELAREIGKLLDCTTWTGAGPGLMDAAIKGALEAKKPVGGFKIAKESGEWTSSNFHPYLPPDTYLTCRFFSARKHGLVDAAVRNNQSDMTAVVAFPGGIGTLDEVFEILGLIQLKRIGSKFPVPFLLMNYDSFYSKLLDFMDECEKWGTIASGEVASLWTVCDGNSEALEYLAEFYNLPESRRNFDLELAGGNRSSFG